jgi:hypothetical protein
VPARPPGRGDVERQAHGPQQHRREDCRDDPGVDGAEPEGAHASGPAEGEHHQRGEARKRGEHPRQLEEAIEADTRLDSVGAEHLTRIERGSVEVGGHLRPPEERRGQQPEHHRGDGYGRGSNDAHRGHLRRSR